MDNFVSLGFGPDGMTAFVGLFLEDVAGAGSLIGRHSIGNRLGLGV